MVTLNKAHNPSRFHYIYRIVENQRIVACVSQSGTQCSRKVNFIIHHYYCIKTHSSVKVSTVQEV
jgi:predicted transcriptional regulator